MLQEVHNDICARLPYGVIVHTKLGDGHVCEINQTLFGNKYRVNVEPTKRETFTEVTPYLRPMESMTEEERKEWFKQSRVEYDCEFHTEPTLSLCNCHLSTDWLNKKMFDHRGFIPMGLALPAKECMYN